MHGNESESFQGCFLFEGVLYGKGELYKLYKQRLYNKRQLIQCLPNESKTENETQRRILIKRVAVHQKEVTGFCITKKRGLLIPLIFRK